MNAGGKSDGFIVLLTRVNKAAAAVAESVEERRPPKGTMLPFYERSGHRAELALIRSTAATGSERWFVIDALTEEPYEGILHVRICTGGRR